MHIELDTHDVIIAEGALSETFIDDDSRGMFHNAHEYCALYAAAATARGALLRPALEEGYELEAVRQHIAPRAGLAPEEPSAGELRGYIDLTRRMSSKAGRKALTIPKRRSASTFFLAGG